MRSVILSPPARRAAQTVSLTVGRLTNQSRMLPSFLIVGAQRCGTTSMYRALSQHSSVIKAVHHKGVHYFDINYGRGLGWYRAHFPRVAQARRVERATGHPPLTFESSPYYMFHPLAAERFARDLPGVKLVVLLRDPVERAYSAHAHELSRGYESEPFERALELEAERIAGERERVLADPGYRSHSLQHHAYVARGEYAPQLEALEGIVGADRLHVVDSGDFFTAPEQVYDRVLEFLGLPKAAHPRFQRHNAEPRPPYPSALQTRLAEHFQPFDEQLVRWLPDVPSWRRSA